MLYTSSDRHHYISFSLGHRLGTNREARVRDCLQPPIPRGSAFVFPDTFPALLRDRVRTRWRPNVPHAETAPPARGTRQILRC